MGKKYNLPNGKILNIEPMVFIKIKTYISDETEAGGILVGYQSTIGNCRIEELTEPYPKDNRTKYCFTRKDPKHIKKIKAYHKANLFYIGDWHTHLGNSSPSYTDFNSWKQALKKGPPKYSYLFFIIYGISSFTIWCGEIKTKKIFQLKEFE